MTGNRAGITPRQVTVAVSSAEGPEVAPPGAGEPPPRKQCARCGAVGTHYLTCPDLRLPSGYRLGDARGPEKH